MMQTDPNQTNPPADPPPDPDPTQDDVSRRERARLEKENRDGKLENIMLRAGLDPAAGMNSLFFKSYEGELTAEAVTESAKGYGLVKEETAPTGDITDPAERQQTQQRQQAQTGGPPGTEAPSEDPRAEAIKVGQAAMANGSTEEAAMGTAFNHIAAAGFGSVADGRPPDRRAQFLPGEPDPRRPDIGW